MAIQIERHFTKSQIFTMYANQVDLGHGNFGYEAAAQFFFGKHLDQLTLPGGGAAGGNPQVTHGLLAHPAPGSVAPAPQSGAARHAREWEDLAGTIPNAQSMSLSA